MKNSRLNNLSLFGLWAQGDELQMFFHDWDRKRIHPVYYLLFRGRSSSSISPTRNHYYWQLLFAFCVIQCVTLSPLRQLVKKNAQSSVRQLYSYSTYHMFIRLTICLFDLPHVYSTYHMFILLTICFMFGVIISTQLIRTHTSMRRFVHPNHPPVNSAPELKKDLWQPFGLS